MLKPNIVKIPIYYSVQSQFSNNIFHTRMILMLITDVAKIPNDSPVPHQQFRRRRNCNISMPSKMVGINKYTNRFTSPHTNQRAPSMTARTFSMCVHVRPQHNVRMRYALAL